MEHSRVQFLGYRVPEIAIEVKDSFLTNQDVKNNLAINIQKNFSKDNSRFVEVLLSIKVLSADDNLKVSLVIKGGFLADKEMPDEMFQQFYNVGAPAILYPYARAIVSSCTSQAAIPQVILPLMNFTESPPVLQEPKSEESATATEVH